MEVEREREEWECVCFHILNDLVNNKNVHNKNVRLKDLSTKGFWYSPFPNFGKWKSILVIGSSIKKSKTPLCQDE